MLVLWASYLFQYSESPAAQESFNRPLVDKINDVASPTYHVVLATMATTHVVPRAYLWGFADTIRAGMEGREDPQLFFGRLYHYRGPRYFFPATIAIKVPIGLLVVLMIGFFLFLYPSHFDGLDIAWCDRAFRRSTVSARPFDGRDLRRNSSRFAGGRSAFRSRGDRFRDVANLQISATQNCRDDRFRGRGRVSATAHASLGIFQ